MIAENRDEPTKLNLDNESMGVFIYSSASHTDEFLSACADGILMEFACWRGEVANSQRLLLGICHSLENISLP